MPRAFLVKKRRERQELYGNDVLLRYASSFGTHESFVVDPQSPYQLSVSKPEGDFLQRCDGDASCSESKSISIDNERSIGLSESSHAPRGRTTADDGLNIARGVKIEKDDIDMPLDLSNHKSESILPGNLPYSPRSAFQPVQRLFVRPDSEAVARSHSVEHALHLREFFDLPSRNVVKTSQSHSSTITGHELTYIRSNKVLSYTQKLPVHVICTDPMEQLNEDYIPQRQYKHRMPVPLSYAIDQTSAYNTHLESKRNPYKSSNTIPITDRSTSNETQFLVTDSNKQNVLVPSPEHFNRFDDRPARPNTSPSGLVGGQLHKEFLKQHLVSIRGAMYIGQQGHKRQARAPVPGLEYIQNGSDTRLRTMIESECNEIGRKEAEGFVKTECQGPPPEATETTFGNTLTSNHEDDATDNKAQQLKKYMCDVCGKGFSRSNTLVTHKRIHTGDKPFKCEMCGRAFRQPGNLTRHRLTHTTVKPYVCSQCGKAFNRASNLHTHMRTHTNYKPFVCQYCGKGFHQKIDMKIHSYTHTGEKPHKCKKCGRGFKQLTHLTYHMRTHSDVKMYTCAYCGKGFNQKGNLQAHIYGHTGERPYKCEICGKGFTLASTLNTHRRTHADRKPFICQYCGKDFYQKNALKGHMIASHPFTGSECIL